MQQPFEQPNNEEDDSLNYAPMSYTPEGRIDNIVAQIDPQNIIDNFNHALNGEYYDKESGQWKMNSSGKPLVNNNCRGWIISTLTAVMNNASTMGTINEKQFSALMEGIIRSVVREFVCNLEYFGFVPPGKGYEKGEFMNRGIPDTNRMTSVSEMIYQRSFIIYSRSLSGMESRKIFSSLNMTDQLYQQPPQQKQGILSRMFK